MIFYNKIRYQMKTVVQKCPVKCFLLAGIFYKAILSVNTAQAQSCPPTIGTTLPGDRLSGNGYLNNARL
jgi:hypothetical protein